MVDRITSALRRWALRLLRLHIGLLGEDPAAPSASVLLAAANLVSDVEAC